MVDRARPSVESDYSNVDPSTDDNIDDKLLGTKSDSSLIVSKSRNTHMEDVTKATNCSDLTDVDKTEGLKKLKTINLVLYKLYPTPQFAINLPNS